jgi:hypothetical protein
MSELEELQINASVQVSARLRGASLRRRAGGAYGRFEALLREGTHIMLAGDVDTGKAILHDYIKATVGFEKLGLAIGTQPMSLIRMFGPRRQLQPCNLFDIIGYVQKQAGVELHVTQGPGQAQGHAGRSEQFPFP